MVSGFAAAVRPALLALPALPVTADRIDGIGPP